MFTFSYPVPIISVWILWEWYTFTTTRNKLAEIPTIGPDTFVWSYLSAWRFVFAAKSMIQEGGEKYPNGIFKVYTLEAPSRWLVVVNGEKFTQELTSAKEHHLSKMAALLDLIQAKWTLGKDAHKPAYHIDVIQCYMTRHLTVILTGMADEVHHSIKDTISLSDEWVEYPCMDVISRVICRSINRAFVGLPSCRDKEYLEIQRKFGVTFMASSYSLNLLPKFLKGIVAKMIVPYSKTIQRLDSFCNSLLTQRRQNRKEPGTYCEGGERDLVSGLLDVVPVEDQTAHDLGYRLTIVNFASVHTTSIATSNIILELAARQSYISNLREEVERVIATYGWTKEAMENMVMLESFMMEVSRHFEISAIGIPRQAVKDFTFSNGITIPVGCSVATSTANIHMSSDFYQNPDEFDGYRYLKRKEDGHGHSLKQRMVGLGKNYLFFGSGRHPCPGRVFATIEMKCILAELLLNYDFKLPPDGNPPSGWFGTLRFPKAKSKVLFRKRRSVKG
ncbi:cytochrome P450 [Coprinopsis marcescibilis]|uniref:Cytochrome P450 n=1 Tax=Coprinopsis marcescibilis TaxID=230819 RepID=A0A5C3KVW6_COPMA|nr:cytochrome P450 [Coprinopsis marcescibilis]